jgi:hypothetical protein
MQDGTVDSNALSDIGEQWTAEVLLNCLSFKDLQQFLAS